MFFALRDWNYSTKAVRDSKYYGGFPEERRKHHQELALLFDEGKRWIIVVNPSRNHSVEMFMTCLTRRQDESH
jgi:hypothetical protein